ncbi:MAG: efflux RND transporter periplasmic adaptor subunit [Candidatus Krumholzibacteriota bacterium]|nr:efflux RND transporter periplasmic adaptor subunit [Candidatus Krumholzibacteriota bacterium]
MKKTILILIPFLLFSSCGKDDDSVETEISTPVSVEEIRLKSIEQFSIATGTVNSSREATLKSEKRGDYHLLTNPVTGRQLSLGDPVRKGQVIIHLENIEEQNSIRIDSRKLNLETSRLDFEKQKSLYEKGGVTLTELKNSERTYMDARYDYDNALIQQSKLDITAPFDGIITTLPYYTSGTMIEAGNIMVQIMDYSDLYLEVSLPGKDLGKIEAGYSVRIMNYAIPDDTLSGKVTQVSPTLDPETRSFRASIDVRNDDLLLRPGMFVKAEIIVAMHDSTIVIPKEIILVKQRGKTVFIVEKGAAQERMIITGLENPDEIEVLEGLKKDDRLVIKGFETLRNRSKVKVIR